jgi:hypothetical protein
MILHPAEQLDIPLRDRNVLLVAAGSRRVPVPLHFASASGVLSFLSTTTVFGTPLDITLSELAIESFFPADAVTADIMRRLAEA